MIRLTVIFLLSAVCAIAQEPASYSNIAPNVVLDVVKVKHVGKELNESAKFEARTIARLTRHSTGKENYLFDRTAEIRELSKTDPAEAERQTQALIEQFKAWGVEL